MVSAVEPRTRFPPNPITEPFFSLLSGRRAPSAGLLFLPGCCTVWTVESAALRLPEEGAWTCHLQIRHRRVDLIREESERLDGGPQQVSWSSLLRQTDRRARGLKNQKCEDSPHVCRPELQYAAGSVLPVLFGSDGQGPKPRVKSHQKCGRFGRCHPR